MKTSWDVVVYLFSSEKPEAVSIGRVFGDTFEQALDYARKLARKRKICSYCSLEVRRIRELRDDLDLQLHRIFYSYLGKRPHKQPRRAVKIEHEFEQEVDLDS